MRRALSLAMLCLTLAACEKGSKDDERPPNVLAPGRMVRLLTSAHVQEARLQVRRLEAKTAKLVFDHAWDSTTRALGTDTAAFSRSFVWYARHVADLDAVYEQIVDSIGVEESRAAGKADTAKKAATTSATPAPAAQKPPAPDSAAKRATPAGIGPGFGVRQATGTTAPRR